MATTCTSAWRLPPAKGRAPFRAIRPILQPSRLGLERLARSLTMLSPDGSRWRRGPGEMALRRCGYGGRIARRSAGSASFARLTCGDLNQGPDECVPGRAPARLPLLHDAFGGLRLQFDFAKGGLVLRDVLLQNAEQRLGLLRADVDALETVDDDVLRRGLVHAAEQEKEIPQIHPHLDAVGVALPVVGRVNQLNLGGRRLNHSFQ